MRLPIFHCEFLQVLTHVLFVPPHPMQARLFSTRSEVLMTAPTFEASAECFWST
jgi:hypothetical protein